MAQDLRLQYKLAVDRTTFPPPTEDLNKVSLAAQSLQFRREKNSHQGILYFKNLRNLVAYNVNQDFLEQISNLPHLEFLYIRQINATNAECLGQCKTLRHLTIQGGTKFTSLDWLTTLPPLESLLLEHFKRVTDVSSVCALTSLKAFGFEGDLHNVQKIDSFNQFTSLPNLEALFLCCCRPIQDGLKPLQRISTLRHLEISGRFPDQDFMALRKAVPDLHCDWFQDIDQYGSIKAYIKAKLAEMKKKRSADDSS